MTELQLPFLLNFRREGVLNENYIKLLENFSNSTSPVNPITGQVWWDSSDSRLKVYNGTTFKAVGGPFVQPSQPTMVAGDLWINNNKDQMYFFDGTDDPVLAGPVYSKQQGTNFLCYFIYAKNVKKFPSILKLHDILKFFFNHSNLFFLNGHNF